MHRPKNNELLADKAYEMLKWKILCGDIKGDRLYDENSLSELIKLGRSPVRSALLRLQHDRLVEVIPRKGILVRSISPQEISEIVQMRLAVEPMVARLAVAHATNEELKKIEKLISRMDKDGGDTPNIERAMRIDNQFHNMLAQSTNNSVLAEVVSFLKNRSSVLWFKSIITTEQIGRVKDEHREILNAIKARDEEKAVKAMTQHLETLNNRPR